MTEFSFITDYSDPMASLTRGFHGDPPQDLSGVTLNLGNLTSMAAHAYLWSAHGIIPSSLLKELSTVGQVKEPVEMHVMANPVFNEGKIRIRVRGRCWGAIQLECVRCLTEFNLPLEVEIDALFAPGVDPAMKNKRWQIEEDVIFLADGHLRLKRLAEEELLLALPMNPLCFSACAGLCAGCGADLNQTQCQCQKAKPTGPFAVLKKLKSS